MTSLSMGGSQRNVIAFFGINGVGKSAIADFLNTALAGSIRVQASCVLRNSMGMDRQALEGISQDTKMAVKVPAILQEFNRAIEYKYILLDMHLIIPIRQKEVTIYEDVWSDVFFPYILKAYFIFAASQSILDRRVADMNKTGRRRNMSIKDIASDQRLNLEKFNKLFLKNKIGKVVNSTNRNIEEVAKEISKDLLLIT